MTTLTQNVEVATVFGRQNCPQCEFTKRECQRIGVPIRYIDITEAPDAAAFLKADGFASLPVVYPADDRIAPWAGFRPSLIASLAGKSVA